MNKFLRFGPCLMALVLFSTPVFADDSSAQEIEALKAEIAKLSQKVDQLQAEEEASKDLAPPSSATPVPSSSDNSVTKGDFPGSFRVPGSSTSVKIGGYVKLDAIEDVGSGYGANYAKFYAIPLSNSPQAQQSAQTTLGIQQSRLNFETRTPSSFGEIKTFIEGDFYGATAANGNTNGYGFELRHAYGSLGSNSQGQLLAGQTWSDFVDPSAMPESMDYVGPAGLVFVRQAQIRYTHDVNAVTLSASAEMPVGNQSTETQNAVTYSNSTTTDSAHGQMPDLIVRGDYKYASDGYTSVRVLANQVSVDHSLGANNYTATRYGYGVAFSGKQGVISKDAVLYEFVTGQGTGRYVYDINAAGNYYNTSTNQLETQDYYAGTLGYQHLWSEQFRSNIFGGVVRNVNDVNFTGLLVNKYVASGHANLVWQPLDAYKVGLEYMHGYRKLESGVEGNLNRVEASFIYGF